MFYLMNLNRTFSASLLTLLFFLTACGSNQNITLKGVDVSTSEISGKTYVNMEAIVLLGNLQFPNLDVSIPNPTNQQSLGQMSLQHLSDGSNRLDLSIDYTEATRLNSGLGATLPNGREIPSSLGVGTSVLIGIPILQQSKIYIGGDLQKDLFLGAAIAIPAFDSVLGSLKLPLNLFYTYPFSAEINAVGGIFSGSQAGQNGIALFVKRTNPDTIPAPTPTTAPPIAIRNLASVSTTTLPTEAEHVDQITAFRLSRLMNKTATLRVK